MLLVLVRVQLTHTFNGEDSDFSLAENSAVSAVTRGLLHSRAWDQSGDAQRAPGGQR